MNQFGKGSQESGNGSRTRHSVLRQLATLETMTMAQLHEKWRDLYGGLSEAAKTHLKHVAENDPAARVDGRVTDSPPGQADILPGTRFVRIWKDRRYEVLAHQSGFEYDGRMFRSLSAVAREITGTRWNGKLFFGLKKTNEAGGRYA